jgi:hypothetical protein
MTENGRATATNRQDLEDDRVWVDPISSSRSASSCQILLATTLSFGETFIFLPTIFCHPIALSMKFPSAYLFSKLQQVSGSVVGGLWSVGSNSKRRLVLQARLPQTTDHGPKRRKPLQSAKVLPNSESVDQNPAADVATKSVREQCDSTQHAPVLQ